MERDVGDDPWEFCFRRHCLRLFRDGCPGYLKCMQEEREKNRPPVLIYKVDFSTGLAHFVAAKCKRRGT